jgi:hypothetical protein
MTDETPRAGEMCADCGTPLEVADVNDDADAATGATLVLRCPNGHVRTVHRTRESVDAQPPL